MFESGIELKKQYGENNVFDFSLGNPDVPPPAPVADALVELARDVVRPLGLGYMPNAGYPDVRATLAKKLSAEQDTELSGDHVIMTCGAAGAINALSRAVLEPGDEVVCPAPFFVEYVFYVAHYGGKLVPVKSTPLTFELDVHAIDQAITPKTRMVLINSPNNPTGQVYTRDEISALAAVLEKHSQQNGRPLFLVSDEPYRFLAYDDVHVPPILSAYRYSIVLGSYSKSLSMAGERIGYLAVNPDIEDVSQLLAGIVFTNRTLGYVNAPAIGQRILQYVGDVEVDTSIYDERRHAMAGVLTHAGIPFTMPKGAFYFFPRIPVGEDDAAFVRTLMEEHVLAVPGSGFGYPGYFRLTFCIDKSIIERSAPAFKRAVEKARAQ